MTAILLRGAPLTAQLRDEIQLSTKRLVEQGGRHPKLATILVDRNAPSEAYRSSISRSVKRVGLEHQPVDLPGTISPSEFVDVIRRLNDDESVTGVLVLLPLPVHLPVDLVQDHLSPIKDVDGITPTNAGRLHLGMPSLRPSTPSGGIEILDFYGLDPRGVDAAVIGRSNVVGRPFATMLTQRHATVTVCHRQTRDLPAVTRNAGLVALGAGHPGLLTREMVKPGAIVVDFGVNVVDDQIVGDADRSVRDVAAYLTPVPGGTGPVTALALARNVIAAGYASLNGGLDHVNPPDFHLISSTK